MQTEDQILFNFLTTKNLGDIEVATTEGLEFVGHDPHSAPNTEALFIDLNQPIENWVIASLVSEYLLRLGYSSISTRKIFFKNYAISGLNPKDSSSLYTDGYIINANDLDLSNIIIQIFFNSKTVSIITQSKTD